MSDQSEVLGVSQMDAALSKMSWHLVRDTNKAMGDYAQHVMARAQRRASAAGRLARMVAAGMSRDTSGGGTLTAGGGDRLPSGTGTYGNVFFGAEWGGGSRPATRQFKPWRAEGYWFYPAVREAYDTDLDANVTALEIKAVKVWVS